MFAMPSKLVRVLPLILGCLAITLVAVLDWWIGTSFKRDLSVLPLYLLPLVGVAWLSAGRMRLTMLAVAYAGVAWFVAQKFDPSQADHSIFELGFNGVGRTLVFGIVAWLAASLRRTRATVAAVTEDATGLLTRLGLAEAFMDPARGFSNHTPPSALLLLDVERALNVEGGHRREHAAMVAAMMAKLLRDHARADDLCVRLSTDQYAILMPKTRKPDAEGVTHNLLGALARLQGAAQGFTVTSILCTSESLGTEERLLLRHTEQTLTGFKARSPGHHAQTTIDKGQSALAQPGAQTVRI
jgi:GGDEF domain-containing protein